MARRLLQRGHSVLMVCGSSGQGQTGISTPFEKGMRRGFVDGIEVVEFDIAYSNGDGFVKRTASFLSFAVRSVRVALTEKYDLLFATSTPLTAGIPGIFARWLRGKPFVFEVRDLWPELPKAMGVIRNPLILTAMSVLEWISYKSAYRLVGLSSGIAEGIRRRGISEAQVTMIPNGCDLNVFAPTIPPFRPFTVSQDELLAVFTGTHGIANGLDAVLDAAAELMKRGRNDIKILLVGDGRLKGDLIRRVQLEGLSNVSFHDPLPKAFLAQLLSGADLGLQILANVPAFYYGTSPNKFFDYISAGLPVLVNYPGWVADTIDGESLGFAVPPQDAAAFADALQKAANDKNVLKMMGQRSRQFAERNFSRDLLGRQFVDWLEGAAR